MQELAGQGTDEKSHPLRTAIAGIVLLVIVLVVLLLWNPWRGNRTSRVERGGGIVETLSDRAPSPTDIAIWARPGLSVEALLTRHGLSGATVTAFGDGTYVVSLPSEINADKVVEQLKRDDSLYDAGHVYMETK